MKVTYAKAGKDYPEIDVVKGEMYYWWQAFRGPKQMSKTEPKPSQVASGKLAEAYMVAERIEADTHSLDVPDDIADMLDECASDIGDVADQYRESFENMPEGLQQGDTGQQLESNADELDAWKDQVESAAQDIRNLDIEEFIDPDLKRDDDKQPTCFLELTDEEQEEMLEAARAIADDASTCPI
jgi:hypothetical protein